MERRQAVSLVGAIAVFLVVTALIVFQWQKNGQQENGGTLGSPPGAIAWSWFREGDSAEDRREENLSKYSFAVGEGNVEACSDIREDSELQKKCEDNAYASLAGMNDDRSYCDKISDWAERARCGDAFSYDEAVAKSDTDACGKLSEEKLRDACVRTVTFGRIESGSFTGTVTETCSKLTDVNDRKYCESRIEKDSSVELAKKALETKDRTICLKIQDAALSQSCSDTLLIASASLGGDVTSCLLVKDEEKKGKCQTVATAVSDAKKFQEIVKAGDSAGCRTIQNAILRTKCVDVVLLKISAANKSKERCGEITDTTMKSQCASITSAK